jgi:hypothetical protein
MKKLSLNIIFLFAGLIIIIGCDRNSVTITGNDGGVPNVKSVTQWDCNVNTGQKTVKLNYKEYSKDGHLIKEIDYTSTGLMELVSNFSYSNSQSIEQKTYYNPKGEIDSSSISKYIYNTLGFIAQKIDYNSKGDSVTVINYEYNNKGYITKSTKIDISSQNISSTDYQYKYNNSGSISSVLINSNEIETKDSLTYEPEINKVVTITYNSNNEVLKYKVYIYNNYGEQTSITIFDNKNTIISKNIYEYQYY